MLSAPGAKLPSLISDKLLVLRGDTLTDVDEVVRVGKEPLRFRNKSVGSPPGITTPSLRTLLSMEALRDASDGENEPVLIVDDGEDDGVVGSLSLIGSPVVASTFSDACSALDLATPPSIKGSADAAFVFLRKAPMGNRSGQTVRKCSKFKIK